MRERRPTRVRVRVRVRERVRARERERSRVRHWVLARAVSQWPGFPRPALRLRATSKR